MRAAIIIQWGRMRPAGRQFDMPALDPLHGPPVKILCTRLKKTKFHYFVKILTVFLHRYLFGSILESCRKFFDNLLTDAHVVLFPYFLYPIHQVRASEPTRNQRGLNWYSVRRLIESLCDNIKVITLPKRFH